MKALDEKDVELLQQVVDSSQPALGVGLDLLKLRNYVTSRLPKVHEDANETPPNESPEKP